MRYLTVGEALELHHRIIESTGGSHVDEQEQVILSVASGAMERVEFTTWLQTHIVASKQK